MITNWPFNFLIFILGLIVGSFLNVVIYRLNTGASWRVLNGRSRCLHCGKTLRWWELLPLGSWLALRARCARCHSRISWQYPAVELATGLLFVLIWLMPWTGLVKVINLVIWSLLVVIFVYDLKHQIIPDVLVYAVIVLAALAAALSGQFLPALCAALGLAAFFWLLWLGSRGRAIGFGDGKLALAVGLLAGPRLGVSAIVLAFWIGAIVGLGLMAWSGVRRRGKRATITMRSALPFAPFIIVGLALALFGSLNVFNLF